MELEFCEECGGQLPHANLEQFMNCNEAEN